MITKMQYREQAVRLLAISLVTNDVTRAGHLACLSAMAQADAGITLANDDPEVVALVAKLEAEDRRDHDAEHAQQDSEARCPRRE